MTLRYAPPPAQAPRPGPKRHPAPAFQPAYGEAPRRLDPALHLLESGYDIRTVQALLGHRSVQTTMIYPHVLNRGGRAVRSPLD